MSGEGVIRKIPKELVAQLHHVSTWFQQNGAFHRRQLHGLDEWVDLDECLKKASTPKYKDLGNALLQLCDMVYANFDPSIFER